MSIVARQFNSWITSEDGRRVFREALVRSLKLLSKGVTRYGIAAIFDSIRYDWSVGLLGDGEYRLNNNHRSLLAREIMLTEPRLAGFFETRTLRGR
jgi:hypothetical protein